MRNCSIHRRRQSYIVPALVACTMLAFAPSAAQAQQRTSTSDADRIDGEGTTSQPIVQANSPQVIRATFTSVDSRSMIVDAEFAELPQNISALSQSSGELQSAVIPGINLPGYVRELGISAQRIEIIEVETVEQRVAGISLQSLDEAPLTNDIAADRAAARRMRPLAPAGLFPAEWAEVVSVGTLHGRPVSVLRLQPYRYDAARGVVLAAKRIRLKIHTSIPIEQNATASLATAFAERSRKINSTSLLTSSSSASVAPDGFEYKIYVDRDGVFRLTAKDLADAGIPVDAIDASTLKLYADGIEQPLLVSDRGDNRLETDPLVSEYIEFFGERRRAQDKEPTSDLYYDQHARYSVYFLTWGGSLGKRLVDESGVIQSERIDPLGDLTSLRAAFMSTIHLEEDRLEVLLGNAELNTPTDRFDRLVWGVVRPNEFISLDVAIPYPDLISRRPVSVTVALRSVLRNSGILDSPGHTHNVEVFVDQFRTIDATVPVVGLAILDNQKDAAEQLTSDKLSLSGRNKITIVNRRPDRNDILSDLNVNWVDITYPRSYIALNDSIEFNTPPGLGSRYVTFRVRRFGSPNIRVYRRGISRFSNISIVGSSSNNTSLAVRDSTYDVIFQAYVASDHEKFFAVTEEEISRPVILRDSPAHLMPSTNAGDFIIIVDETTSRYDKLDESSHALRRFMDFKSRNGFTPKVVRAADIYDEFSGGAVSPLAIKKFLGHAYRTWSKAPRYALIFSRGYPVPIDGLAAREIGSGPILSERSYVPSFMLQTVLYGATECDYLLGCVEGKAEVRTNLYEGTRTSITDDLIAEVIVGRVAVNNYDDIDSYVSKVIEQYEAPSSSDDWRFRSLMIGGFEALQGQQVATLVDEFERHVSEPHQHIASDAYLGSRYELNKGRSILSAMSSGVGLITYLGHGAGGQWEESTELNIPNASSVANRNRMAPVLSLTCFTGAYNVDNCLVGRLMVSPNGGAVQALATPGFGWLRNNGYFARSLFTVMHNPRYRSLSFGEIVTLGKALYVGTYIRTFPDHVPTVAAMFTIFGDPSLVMPYALDTATVVGVQSTAIPGGTIDASTTLRFSATYASASVFDTSEVEIPGTEASVRVEGNRVVMTASVPAGYDQSYIGFRLNASNQNGDRVSGAIRFPTGSNSVSVVRPLGTLSAGSDAVFEIEHYSSASLQNVSIGVRYADGPGFAMTPVAVSPGGVNLYRTSPLNGTDLLPGAIVDIELPSTTTGSKRIHTFHVEGGPDPAAFELDATDSARARYGPRASFEVGKAINESIGMTSTPSGARLALTSYNWGDRDAINVPYRVGYDSARTRVSLASGVVSIPARGSTVVYIDAGMRLPVNRSVTLTLSPDKDDRWSDAYQRNNVAYHNTSLTAGMIRSGVGFTNDGATAAPYTIPQIFSMWVDPTLARSDGLVAVDLDSAAPKSNQEWPVLPIGEIDWRGAALRLRAQDVNASTSIQLSLVVGEDTVPGDAHIVGYDSTTRLWIAYATTRVPRTNILTASVPATGLYAVARIVDNTGPRIKFSVEGQFYLDSSAVAQNARFGAVVFDESGIDPDKFSATLDGVPLELGRDIVWLDSTITPSSASLRLQKQAVAGIHSLCVTAGDRVGNIRTECTNFEIEGELALRMYGNFPNPFSSETFIAYEIRGASFVDDVEVKIFSTAGKLVRTYRFPTAKSDETRGLFSGGTGEPTAIGYHEVWWDGQDDAGREVANGVYFYRIRVGLDDQSIEEIGTLARIR